MSSSETKKVIPIHAVAVVEEEMQYLFASAK